jgi:hypothetical protein
MQKLIFSIALFCALNSTCKAQTKVMLDSNGNYVQFLKNSLPETKIGKYKETGKFLIEKSGKKSPVLVSFSGKEFVFVVSKKGNKYRKYLTVSK